MNNTMKNIRNFGIATIIGTTICLLANQPNDFEHQSTYNGMPVSINRIDGEKRIVIRENRPHSSRMERPGWIFGKASNWYSGFKNIEVHPAFVWETGVDSTSISKLQKYANPDSLDKIFAYVKADMEMYEK